MPKRQSGRKGKGSNKSKRGRKPSRQNSSHNTNNITLDQINFEFIESCNDRRTMKRVVSLLENESFDDLKAAAITKLQSLAPESKSEDTLESQPPSQSAQQIINDLEASENTRRNFPRSHVPPIRNQPTENGNQSTSTSTNGSRASTREEIQERLALSEKTKGNEAFKAGDYPEAINHYSRGIKQFKKHAALFANRAACYLKLNEYSKAASDCTKALELDGTYVKAFNRRGEAHMGLKRWKSALHDFERGLELDPNNTLMRQRKAAVEKKLSKKAKGFRVPIETVTSDDSKATESEQPTRIEVQQGSFSDDEDDEDDGKREEPPATAPAPVRESATTPRQQPTPSNGTAPRKQYPKAESWKKQGNELFKDGQYEEAIAVYQRAVNSMKDCKPDTNVPIEWYELTCQCLNNQALSASQCDDFDHVIQTSSESIRLLDEVADNASVQPTLWKALFRRSLAFDKAGNAENAFDDMQRAYKILSNEKTQSNLVRLRREFAEDVSANANDAKDRGNVMFKSQRLDEALEVYSHAIEKCKRAEVKISLRGSLKTTTTNLISNRGLVLSKLDRLEEAIDDFTYILERLDASHVKSRKRRGTCLETLERWTEARNDWEALKEMGVDVEDCEKHLREIAQRLPVEEEVMEENEIPVRLFRRVRESFIEFRKAWSRVKNDPRKVFQLCVFAGPDLPRLLKSNLSREILESFISAIRECGLANNQNMEESLRILECVSECEKLSLTMMMVTDRTQLPAVLDMLSQASTGQTERIDVLRRKFNLA